MKMIEMNHLAKPPKKNEVPGAILSTTGFILVVGINLWYY